MSAKRMEALYLFSWVVALIATAGSLYFSEVMGFTPCDLCWYQRLFMYPLIIVIGVAIIRKDWKSSYYILPFSIIGGSISIYHYTLQKSVYFSTAIGDGCGIVPCTTQYINWLGFITIPFLAFIAFVIITITHIMILKKGLK